MKTYTEYEPSDIKMEGFAEGEKMDEVHSWLLGQIFVVGITGFKPQPGDPPDDKTWPVKRLIADFLNSAAKSGISITKVEPVPAAYSAAFKAE